MWRYGAIIRPLNAEWVIHACNAHGYMCMHSQTHTLRHMHEHPGSVSEGISSSTFPLHQSVLSAASAPPGLPGLAATGDLLTCSFVAELCGRICMCVCVCVLAVRSNSSLILTRHCQPGMFERMGSFFVFNSEVVVEQPAPHR